MLLGAPGGGIRAYGKESAPVRVLLLGPEEAPATAHSPKLTLSGVAAQLGAILTNDPAFDGRAIKVEVESIQLARTVPTRLGQAGDARDIPCRGHTLLQYYYWPSDRDARLGRLCGGWDAVVLVDDPLEVTRLPEFHAVGVGVIARKVRSRGWVPVYSMPWTSSVDPGELQRLTAAGQRVANGTDVALVPAAMAWASLAASHSSGKAPLSSSAQGEYLTAACIYSSVLYRDAGTSSSYRPFGEATIGLAGLARETARKVPRGVTALSDALPTPSGISGFTVPTNSKRAIAATSRGTSTEAGFAAALTTVLRDVARVDYASIDWQAVTVEGPADFMQSRINAEPQKQLLPPEPRWPAAFGFGMQQYNGRLSMPYFIDQDGMAEALGMQDSELGRRGARYVPVQLLVARLLETMPGLEVQTDNWHLSAPVNQAVAAFMYTLLSRRCPVGAEPEDKATPVWQLWEGRRVGYETAWQMASLTARVPGFEVLPAARDATVVTPDQAAAMSVCFRDAPREPVRVQVTIRPDRAATASPAELVFTPENHDVPQTVTFRATPGTVASEPFKVAMGTSSKDVVFHGLSDEWDYVASRRGARGPAKAP